MLVWLAPPIWAIGYLMAVFQACLSDMDMDCFHPTGILVTLTGLVPSIMIAILLARSPWFRKQFILMILVYLVLPWLIQPFHGVTQGGWSSIFRKAVEAVREQIRTTQKLGQNLHK